MVANPVSPSDACGLARCAISGLVIAPSSQWVALASAGAGRCELPAPVRIRPYRRVARGVSGSKPIRLRAITSCSLAHGR